MRVELLEGAERRRRWSFEDKARIVEASYEARVSVCSVARRHGIAQGLLFTWRRQARQGRLGGDEQAPVLVPVAVTEPPSGLALRLDDPGAQAQPRRRRRKTGVMEIDLGGGRRLRVDRDVDAAALRRVLDALEGR